MQRTREMIDLLRHRGPDGAAVWDGGQICLGHVHLKITGDHPQPVTTGRVTFVYNGEIFNYRDFSGSPSDTGALAGLLSGGIEAFIDAAPSINGDYSLAAWDGEKLALVRDPLGVKPLYYGYTADGFGFASEKKALWRAGIRDVRSLAPGAMFSDGEERRVVDLPAYDPVLKDEARAVEMLEGALAASVQARAHEDAAIAFSGGLDSALIGALAPETPLLTVGLAGSHDLGAARRAARLMGAEGRHTVYEITQGDVEEALPGTIRAVESPDPLRVAIALPLYVLAQRARRDGFRVLLSGQGADELFAGYARYEKASGESALQGMLDHDLRHIARTNLERDDAAAMAHGVELRVPYLDPGVVAVSRQIDPSLKLRANGKDYIRKYVLRKVADKHLPQEASSAPKKAIQYGTGVQRALERLAKARGTGLAGYLQSLYRVVLQ
jgi:asparagine synthase (glutamine-hydrolysing)